MVVTLVIFSIMALFYKYVDFNESEEDKEKTPLELPVIGGDLPEKPPAYSEKPAIASLPNYVPARYTAPQAPSQTNGTVQTKVLPAGSANDAFVHDESTNM